MKIAFVGKGGSGKSTTCALFIQHLLREQRAVLAVDADINQHLAQLVGAELKPELALYEGKNPSRIRTHLRGQNERIESAKHFVKTTPPGKGSNLVHLTSGDPIIRNFTVPFAQDGYFMHVGTYGESAIGTSCYHSNLSVFENVISHTVLGENQWLVADMVAGTDAFAGALYLLFDVIFMVVEPTPESVGVFRQFAKLAASVDTLKRVFAIANKVQDEDDEVYLREELGNKMVAVLPQNDQLRKARQRGEALPGLSSSVEAQLETIEQVTIKNAPDADDQLKRLQVLHRHFASQDFTVAKHGDITTQVDEAFSFSGRGAGA
jgi:CO dehydrogenase maturation factor